MTSIKILYILYMYIHNINGNIRIILRALYLKTDRKASIVGALWHCGSFVGALWELCGIVGALWHCGSFSVVFAASANKFYIIRQYYTLRLYFLYLSFLASRSI